MTGFGAAAVSLPGGRLAVEMRSVNHRFSEIQIRLPRDLAGLEDRVRAVVQGRVLRGRVEVSVTREDSGRRARVVRADTDLAAAYAQALRTLARAVGAAGDVTIDHLVALPDVVGVEEDRPELDAVWPALEEAVRSAADALVAMRAAEGRRLAQDVLARLDALGQAAEVIAARSRLVVQAYRDRLRARLAELLGDVPVDEARIATELAVVAERSDITEELVRFRSHLAQFRDTVLGEDGAVGRKLEFILQEMGREVNTVGAKANDLEITRQVIAMKAELESLREQVQNVE
ncbi:MAG: YicC/YloC family endoribonuclease [Armatimonadota bacterium]|nr:YicC/YloC family endoribonuclease [Armatimonadota bacterium]